MFSGATRSACGYAQAAMGPFYCPNDQKVYLDTSFFEDIKRRIRACTPAHGPVCAAYVIAHEIGHHVQNQLGILPTGPGASSGLHRSDLKRVPCGSNCRPTASPACGRTTPSDAGNFLEPGDVEAAMQTRRARSATTGCSGRAQGNVVPDAFTHGTSAQRTRWFMTGLKWGGCSCDTFKPEQL